MATLEYHTGTRGTPGYTVSTVSPLGTTVRQLIPAMALVGSDGSDLSVTGIPSSQVPSSAATGAIVPVVTQSVSAILVKNAAGNFYGASVVNNAASSVAGYLIAYNAAAVPAGGATLNAAQVLAVKAIAAGADGSIDPSTVPDRFGTGIVVLFSTTVATYTVPGVLPVFLKGRGA